MVLKGWFLMGKSKVPRAVLFGAAVFISAVTSSATTRELFFQPGPVVGKDAYVDTWFPTRNFGDDPILAIFGTTLRLRWSYVEFVKLEPYVGSRYECLKATLSLYYYTDNPGPPPWLRVHRAAGPWKKNTITWNNQPGCTSDRCVYWGPTPQKPGWVNINVTKFVTGWFSGKYKHHGFVIQNVEENRGYSAYFYSSDNPRDEKPKLRIKYQCATVEPASLGKIRAVYK